MSSRPIPWYAALNPKAAKQIMAYGRLTPLEVGGMGLAGDSALPDLDRPHVFVLRKAWLLSMGGETSEGYCEVPAKARAGLMFRLAARGLSDNLKWWFHKHPCGGWSGTDTRTMRERVESMRPKGKVQWALSLVLTPDGFRARYDQAGDAPDQNFYVDLPVQIGRAVGEPAWERQIRRLESLHRRGLPARFLDPPARVPAQEGARPLAWRDPEQLELFDDEPYEEPWPDASLPGQDEVDLQAMELTAAVVEERARQAFDTPRFRCKRFQLLTHAAVCSSCAFGSGCFDVTPEDLRSCILPEAAAA